MCFVIDIAPEIQPSDRNKAGPMGGRGIEGLLPSLRKREREREGGRLEAVIIIIIMYVMPLHKKVSVVSGFLQSARRMIMHVKTGSVLSTHPFWK